jgi:serine/threonine-protein kinase
MVLAGAGALDATAATRVAAPLGGTTGGTYGGDERYRAYDATTVRRRNWWPWVIAAGAIIAVVVGGWFLYDNVQKQISENKPVTVQQYTGIVESKAVNLIIQDGLEPKVQRVPSPDQPVGIVFEQSPVEGTSLAKGGIVTIKVSTGKKTVDAPDVVGKQLTDAVAALTRAGLNAKSVGVPSDKPSGTVTAQDPRPGTSIVEGATVRINYSTGPKQVAVPPVVGLDYSTALQQLQAAGFAVARTDVESTQPAGVVTAQVPSGSSTATKGSTVNLSVSNGPQTNPLPDVTGQTQADATATLKAAGFKVKVTKQDTDVETFDGIVISQDPVGNSQQDPNTLVTLFVGKYVPPPTDTTTTTTDTTATTTTTPTPP